MYEKIVVLGIVDLPFHLVHYPVECQPLGRKGIEGQVGRKGWIPNFHPLQGRNGAQFHAGLPLAEGSLGFGG